MSTSPLVLVARSSFSSPSSTSRAAASVIRTSCSDLPSWKVCTPDNQLRLSEIVLILSTSCTPTPNAQLLNALLSQY